MSTGSSNKTNAKTQWQVLRDLLAVLLAAAGAFLGIYGMATSELLVDPSRFNPITQFDTIKTGLEQYCGSFGLILLLVGVAFILVGYNDRVETKPDRLVPEDED